MAKKSKKKNKIKRSRGRPRYNYEFDEAVEVIRKENLRSMGQYLKWWDLHTPSKLPKRPDRAYEKDWKGWGYFLGNYNEFPFIRKKYRSYEDAREYAQSLNLSSVTEWHEFAKSGKKPEDIPARPDVVYQRDYKWHTWSEFLGNRIEIKLEQAKNKPKYFYIAKYPETPQNVFYFGITTSKENLKKDHSFQVFRMYDYFDQFDWRDIVTTYATPYYEYGRQNEYIVNNMGGLISELSLDLIEVPF